MHVRIIKMAFAITSIVHGCHIYKDTWGVEISSELPCLLEPDNRKDCYAMAVMNGTNVIGHVPRRISYVFNIFLRHSGSIICHIDGPRQYLWDLKQGDWRYHVNFDFTGRIKACQEIQRTAGESFIYYKDIKTHFQAEVSSTTVTSSPVMVIDSVKNGNNDKPATVKLSHSKQVIYEEDATKENIISKNSEQDIEKCNRQWLATSGGIKLTSNDRDAIMNEQRLNDLVINFAQKVLRMQFPSVKGFQSTLLQDKMSKGIFEQDKVQIIHSRGNHWIVATTMEATSNDVKVYDSIFDVVDDHTALLISNLFGSLAKPKVVKIPKQLNINDCGLYAIANAATLCFGKDPATLHFNQSLMKPDLVQCLEQKRITHFPLI